MSRKDVPPRNVYPHLIRKAGTICNDWTIGSVNRVIVDEDGNPTRYRICIVGESGTPAAWFTVPADGVEIKDR